MTNREKLLLITLNKYMTQGQLLDEIITSMSEQEAGKMFEHICQHWDIDSDKL